MAIHMRQPTQCNAVEGALPVGSIIYKTFATLHFCVVVDDGESLLDMMGKLHATPSLQYLTVAADLINNVRRCRREPAVLVTNSLIGGYHA
jgi:hypothetical protein